MDKKSGIRFYVLFAVIVLAASCVLARLFSLQVTRHTFYAGLAKDQHEVLEKLIPQRGDIFVQEKGDVWHPLATNRNYQTVFLAPSEVQDKEAVAVNLAPLVGVEKDKILDKLKDPNDPYEPLKSKLDDETAEKIKNLNLKGVHLVAEGWRWYPQGTLASNVLGFVGIKDDQKIGQYGIEQFYNDELAGKSGLLRSERDALGRWLLMSDYDLEPAEDGADLYLTIDQNIQYVVEQKMKGVVEKWSAEGACAIVMDPKTGAIRAMSSLPNFDPNNYKDAKSSSFVNSCTQMLYEPGSVFKPIVMAAGLDMGKISPQTTYTDTGSFEIAGYTIKNSQEKTYGLSTMTQVLEKSINTGVIFAERQLGNDSFRKYIEAFGFDDRCGVDLASEAIGNIANLKSKQDISFATAAFGQGISTTPIQMASAIAAIANNGKMMKPYTVEKIVSQEGDEKKIEPQEVRQVISTQAAGKLTAMLVSTVRNGYDKIKIKGYYVAGKTGTAQIASGDKRGYLPLDQTIHSFAGYAPAYNPKFLIFLKLDRPKGIQFASESLAPVFGDLAQYLLNYYEIPPEE